MRVGVVAFLCCWMSAVAAVEEPLPPPAEVTTTVDEVTVEAPEPRYVAPTLRDRIGRVWAPVYINGQGPFRLVLDTGATSSAIVSSVATRLGIPLSAANQVQLVGTTGSAVVPYVEVERMDVGDLSIADSKLPIVPDVFGGAEGVLGTRGLMDKRIFIDFRHDLIQIMFSRQRAVPIGFTTLPFDLVRGRLITLKLLIGGVRTRAIIDTGAQQSMGNNSLRDALVSHRQQMKKDQIVGVTLDVEQGDSFQSPPISFGNVQVRNVHVTFGDMFIFEHWKLKREPALVIGMDVIGSLDTFIIDYKRRELHVRVRSYPVG